MGVCVKLFSVYYNGYSEIQEGRREGVGVMKDEDLKFEEIETSHTLGREGRYYDAQDQLLKVVPSVRKLGPLSA